MSLLNQYVSRPGIKQTILAFCCLTLILLEWLHTIRCLPTDAYLEILRLCYWPVVWMIDNGCCSWWLAEMLKGMATP